MIGTKKRRVAEGITRAVRIYMAHARCIRAPFAKVAKALVIGATQLPHLKLVEAFLTGTVATRTTIRIFLTLDAGVGSENCSAAEIPICTVVIFFALTDIIASAEVRGTLRIDVAGFSLCDLRFTEFHIAVEALTAVTIFLALDASIGSKKGSTADKIGSTLLRRCTLAQTVGTADI